jgi:hypothetical protein
LDPPRKGTKDGMFASLAIVKFVGEKKRYDSISTSNPGNTPNIPALFLQILSFSSKAKQNTGKPLSPSVGLNAPFPFNSLRIPQLQEMDTDNSIWETPTGQTIAESSGELGDFLSLF